MLMQGKFDFDQALHTKIEAKMTKLIRRYSLPCLLPKDMMLKDVDAWRHDPSENRRPSRYSYNAFLRRFRSH